MPLVTNHCPQRFLFWPPVPSSVEGKQVGTPSSSQGEESGTPKGTSVTMATLLGRPNCVAREHGSATKAASTRSVSDGRH